jgi:hypothetical protein
MTYRRRGTRGGDAESVVADEAEGYLLARSHHDRARREAEDLCGRMPWLTTDQAEDVTRHYIRQRLVLSRQMLGDTVKRAAQLRQEYEDRYATLRRHLLKVHAAAACAILTCACMAAALASRIGR